MMETLGTYSDGLGLQAAKGSRRHGALWLIKCAVYRAVRALKATAPDSRAVRGAVVDRSPR